jgi:hypothetical protein
MDCLYEYGNEFTYSIKGEIFLYLLDDYYLLNKSYACSYSELK